MRIRFYSIMYPLLFLAVFCVNTFFLQSVWIGIPLLAIYLLFIGLRTGAILSKDTEGVAQWWTGLWTFFSVVMIVGSCFYYLATVPAILFQLIIPLSFALFFLPSASPHTFAQAKKGWLRIRTSLTKPVLLAGTSALFLIVLFLRLIYTHRITDAIRSPFDQISPTFLLLFFFALLICSVLLYRGREKSVAGLLFILIIGSLFSFLAISYPVGYGFDPFIHKATESHLAEFGTITPKPFYYIGQYSLVLFFSHAFSIPIDLVDTWLVPLLAALLLPLAWFTGANTLVKKPRFALFCLLGLFLLPLESFTVTTPQNLANLWTILLILASIPLLLEEKAAHWSIYVLATIATILIHPIAGIPVFFFFVLLFLSREHAWISQKYSRLITWITVVIASLALPASFILQAMKSGSGLHLLPFSPTLLLQSMNLSVFLQNRFSPLLDFVYVYGQNIFLFVLLISAYAWWIYRKDLAKHMRIIFLMILILSINYLLLANVIDFSFLIDYERANYANRLIPLITFFLSPLILLAFGHLSMNLRSKPIALKLTCLVLLCAIATASFYLAFPRRDAYVTSHAFNVSQAQVDAVYLIDDWAQRVPYIVLANQSVSAAAMKQLGFRYYGNLFFYPIPTGDVLYQKFLTMNETPTRTTVESALALIPKEENVHTLFYVVDTYWWQSERLIEQAKSIADDWKSVGGTVYIFRFDK